MELWTAFTLGLLGSLHCIGMCGPIVLALPIGTQARWSFVLSRLLYNFGRVITYSAMGLAAGWIGRVIILSGYQNVLSITLGILILLILFLPSKFASKIIRFKFYHNFIARVKIFWADLMRKSSHSSLLVIGILNGFLPCGLVYMALAGAATTGTVLNGFLYMMLFGIGTIPVMFAMTFLGKFVGIGVKRFFNKLIPVAGVLLAVIIIMRGLSLGIPYISPKISENKMGHQKVECCHPADEHSSGDSTVVDTIKEPDEVSTSSSGK